MTARTPATPAAAASGPDARTKRTRGETLRCNAPQRTPKTPDTAWGRLRAAKGWSLRDLEARTGINAGVLSRIERGIGGPGPSQAMALLDAYELITRGEE